MDFPMEYGCRGTLANTVGSAEQHYPETAALDDDSSCTDRLEVGEVAVAERGAADAMRAQALGRQLARLAQRRARQRTHALHAQRRQPDVGHVRLGERIYVHL